MKLRDYQKKAIKQCNRYLLEAQSVIVVMPTASGKTVVASDICKFFEPVVWMAHTRELLDQAGKSLTKAGVEHTLLSTSATKLPTKKFNLAVYDEYHHSAARTNKALLRSLRFERLLGVTATPDRLDRMPLRFERIVEPTTQRELVDQGYLTRIRLFNIRSFGQHVNDLMSWTKHHTGLGKTIFFAKDMAEAETISSKLPQSAVVKGTPAKRRLVLDRFQHGDLEYLISCMILTEGVDIPICRTVVLGRMTYSHTLLSQMVGRAMRLHIDQPPYCNIIEPVLLAPSRRQHVSTSMLLEPDYHYVSALHNGVWKMKQFK